MAKSNGTGIKAVAQAALTDDPDFLRAIVERTGQRNGYKPRTLHTRVGTLTLLVPQDRASTFSTQLFARYQRNEKAPVLALLEMDLEGVSARKGADSTEVRCGTSFSKRLVSPLAGEPD